jgi:16S rRNA (cytosine967-C5)-methyltransferase
MLSRISMPDFMERLAKADMPATPHPSAPDTFLILPHGCNITTLPGFDDGHFTVQDPSTAVSVSLLDVKPGMTVLDACAAPGGKTSLIGDAMNNTGRIVAMDVHEDRLAVLRENFKRLQLKCVEIVKGDAAFAKDIKKSAPAEGYDRILLDVPCSNTGVLQRRPDARWRWSQQRTETLTSTQYAILSTASAFLKPGGILVYSTCSIEPEENANLVRAWLASTKNFTLLAEKSTFPPDSQTDGIYATAVQANL